MALGEPWRLTVGLRGFRGVDWREFLSWIINGTALKGQAERSAIDLWPGMGAKGAASFERRGIRDLVLKAKPFLRPELGSRSTAVQCVSGALHLLSAHFRSSCLPTHLRIKHLL